MVVVMRAHVPSIIRCFSLKIKYASLVWVRPKSDISARSALSAVCSKLPSDWKTTGRYVTAQIGPDQKVPLVVNICLLQMALFGHL